MKNTAPLRLTKLDEIADAAGFALAFSEDGHAWASVEAQRIHVGKDGVLERSIPVEDGRVIGAPRFTKRGTLLAPPFSRAPGASTLTAPFGNVIERLGEGQSLAPRGSYAPRAAAISADGASLFVAGSYHAPSGLHASSGKPAAEARLLRLTHTDGKSIVIDEFAHGEGPDLLALSSTRLAAAGEPLRLYDAANGHPIATLSGHTGRARSLAFTADGALLASGGADGQVITWAAHDGARRQAATLSKEPVVGLAFSHDGSLLAVTGWDDQLRIVDASAPGTILASFALGAHGEAVAFAPDGATLLVSVSDARGTVIRLRVER